MPNGEKGISIPGQPTRRRPDVVQVTSDLVKIPSHKKTEGVVAYIEEKAKEYGLQSRRIPTLHADGSRDEGNPNLIVGNDLRVQTVIGGSHIDTVDPWPVGPNEGEGKHDPFGGTRTEGKVVGLGATDSKGSAAALLVAMAERRSDLARVGVVFTADEERQLRGQQAVMQDYQQLLEGTPKASPELILAGGSNREYSTGSRGVLEAEFEVTGKTLHTSRSRAFINAPEARDRITRELSRLVGRIPEHPILGHANMEKTADRSGQDTGKEITEPTNKVANWAKAILGIRLNGMPIDGRPFTPELLRELIENKIARLNEQTRSALRLKHFETLAHIDAAIADPTKVQWIIDMAHDITREEIVPWNYGKRGLEEMIELVNIFPIKPALVVIGPGEQSQYHQPDEYVREDSLRQYTELYGKVFSDSRYKQKKVFSAPSR